MREIRREFLVSVVWGFGRFGFRSLQRPTNNGWNLQLTLITFLHNRPCYVFVRIYLNMFLHYFKPAVLAGHLHSYPLFYHQKTCQSTLCWLGCHSRVTVHRSHHQSRYFPQKEVGNRLF